MKQSHIRIQADFTDSPLEEHDSNTREDTRSFSLHRTTLSDTLTSCRLKDISTLHCFEHDPRVNMFPSLYCNRKDRFSHRRRYKPKQRPVCLHSKHQFRSEKTKKTHQEASHFGKRLFKMMQEVALAQSPVFVHNTKQRSALSLSGKFSARPSMPDGSDITPNKGYTI